VTMQRILSTYLFVNRKLTAALVGEVARAGVSAIELFCSRGHFDYRSSDNAHELAGWLAGNNLTLHSIHSPTTRDFHLSRESGAPLSICDPERVRRQEAVDEIKRALDLVEHIPFRYCVQHVARHRDIPDDRKWDAAFSSLEHLSLFARHRGVTIAIENTPGEMATPANLKNFLEQTRLTSVKMCFDTGHAHLDGGVPAALEVVRDYVVTTHVHDNAGERDDHLLECHTGGAAGGDTNGPRIERARRSSRFGRTTGLCGNSAWPRERIRKIRERAGVARK
jgi:sugar phosphate isomerase/epimerase